MRNRWLMAVALVVAAQWSGWGAVPTRAGEVGAVDDAIDIEGRITVLADVSVEDEDVYLGDIARLEGPAAQRLLDVKISRAPNPGRTRMVPGASILGTLRRNGVDLDRVRYMIPQAVRVRRVAQEISASTTRAIVDEYIDHTFSEGDRRVTLRRMSVPGGLHIPVGPYLTRITPDSTAPTTGRVRLVVEFLQDDEVVGTVPVTAQLAVLEDVVVTRRGIARGAVIEADDVLREQRDVSSVPRGAITRSEDVIGMQASTSIPALMPLRPEQLAAPTIVHRGDVVMLVAESGGLRITTTGQVREDAALGEQVRVLNLSSQTEVVGRALDTQTVAVGY
jgi:flagella basal body P-ring formation protein FlgA